MMEMSNLYEKNFQNHNLNESCFHVVIIIIIILMVNESWTWDWKLSAFQLQHSEFNIPLNRLKRTEKERNPFPCVLAEYKQDPAAMWRVFICMWEHMYV